MMSFTGCCHHWDCEYGKRGWCPARALWFWEW